MRGFFDSQRIQAPYKSKGMIHSCVSCRLYKFAVSPKMEPYGKGQKGIMIIGESPGPEDDREGKPWQDRAGQILARKLRRLGVDLFEDCVSLNAVNCRPVDKKGGNRGPTEHEIACCRQRVLATVRKYKPRLVLLLGNPAIDSIIGYKWQKDLGGITKWRGWALPDREFQAWVCPTFHPSFIVRQEEKNETEVIWDQDLKQALDKLEEPFPQWKNEEESVIILKDMDEVWDRIKKQPSRYLAFDIETTGLKPYNTAVHQIVSISFCNNEEFAYAIPFPTTEPHLRRLKRILEHPRIGKIAANMKFEDTWMNVLHGIQVKPWAFDTMQASHILDNRPKINGLKFQAYVRYGVLGYDRYVEPYIKAGDTNGVNRILELTNDREAFRRLMVYNGIDSLLEYRLAMKQMKELGIT